MDDRIEQSDRLERVMERLHRVECAAKKGQGGDDEHRDDLQLLEILGPYADCKSKQAKAAADADEEKDHGNRMIDPNGDEDRCRRESDKGENYRFCYCCSNISEHRFKARNWC